MKKYTRPSRKEWIALSVRPSAMNDGLDEIVSEIIEKVKRGGDKAVLDYTERFDKVKLPGLKVPVEEIDRSASQVPSELKKSIETARRNIEKFHSSQLISEPETETMPGVVCWRKSVPVENTGLYIPGGSAPLFSTVLMLGIPARIAGCSKIIVCTPPDINGKANPLILYTCGILGISEVYLAGGSQAVAAMAYGTETIPRVNKIFGPGNQYVTRAKELVMQDGIAIDMPAGPSEVLVIADREADPGFIASDLLSQAEHGADSQVVMLTDSADLIPLVEKEIGLQLEELPRKETAAMALMNSMIILLGSIEECIEFSNVYAPEHLIINTKNPRMHIERITSAGSVFLGKYSCESAGDYASGTNHTLPTNGFAKSYSGVSTESFMKKITFQELNREGINGIGPAIIQMAEAESLRAHAKAVTIRINT